MVRRRNKRKYHLWIATIVILLLAITNIATYRIAEQYIQGKGNVKEIVYKGNNIASTKNATKRLDPTSFKIDCQLVKQIRDVTAIAHPNDGILWTGDHIVKDRHLVIYLTSGNNRIRKKGFERVTGLIGDCGIILNYSDNPKHVKNNWKKVKDPIHNDVNYILSYKEWDSVVTHNPGGEYDHIQHKSTSMIVTNEYVELGLTGKLEHLGKFYEINYLLNHTTPDALDSQDAQAKENLMSGVYLSQGYAHRILNHMVLYEEFIRCKDWYLGF